MTITETSETPPTITSSSTAPRIGESAPRPDGIPKVRGDFSFSSDLWATDMLWGQTLRSPHAHASITNIDISAALAIAGVHAVLLHDDIPGDPFYGLEKADQLVLARDVVRYQGEPVAIVAADHPETARRAADAIEVTYQVLTPLVDPELSQTAAPIHPDGNVFRTFPIRRGDTSATGDVVVEGTYEVGMQDQAFMGTESGMAVPDDDGGIDLYISTQWLHADHRQLVSTLGLPPEKVRLTLAGVGGAFGAREDVSLQVHLCMLALHTGRPIKMVYSREESFFGHVHRHPAKLWYRHHATAEGDLVKVEARILMDGGAYASTSLAVLANACSFAAGPYRVPNAVIDGVAARTNNPPCGAMRGFGNVQACFAHEAQMDKLAATLGMDPLELRLRNALAPGDQILTGQTITGTAPVRELLEQLRDHPVPANDDGNMMLRPGGAGRTADAQHVVRGTGWAVSIKNLMFSEGFDDFSTASCHVLNGVATIKTACAEVGQGFVTLVQQIAREVLGVKQVVLDTVDTAIGSAGSTSASRQTWMSGGAVMKACEQVQEQLMNRAAKQTGAGDLLYLDGHVRSPDGSVQLSVAELTQDTAAFAELEHRHAPTYELDENGQGNAHVSFAFAAHRAVVDVDPELGLIRVVEIATTQDVGRILNPLQALGQIEGGIAQGVGLAIMEEILVKDGLVQNANFTDYLIPTALDMPTVSVAGLIEQPEPGAPFGAKGIGEPPTISSTAAVASAIRAATGLELNRVPVRAEHITFPNS